jgi:invasion protein IalB
MFEMLKKSIAIFLFFIAAAFTVEVKAATPQSLGEYGKWQAFQYQEGAGNVCFVSVKPDKSEGKYKRRDPVFLMVTHRPTESSDNVVSFIAGYGYKANSEVKMTIDGNSYVLLGQDDTAWAPDDVTDKKIVEAIKRGTKLIVEGHSSRGTYTKDSFSLKGSGGAIQAIDKGCGL